MGFEPRDPKALEPEDVVKAFDADRRKVDDKTVSIAILRVLLNIEANIEDYLAPDDELIPLGNIEE